MIFNTCLLKILETNELGKRVWETINKIKRPYANEVRNEYRYRVIVLMTDWIPSIVVSDVLRPFNVFQLTAWQFYCLPFAGNNRINVVFDTLFRFMKLSLKLFGRFHFIFYHSTVKHFKRYPCLFNFLFLSCHLWFL